MTSATPQAVPVGAPSAPSAGQAPRITLTPLERPAFAHLFSLADPKGTGIVTGQAAVAFFAASKLAPAQLGQIWALADSANNGFLAPPEFSIALRLIGHVQRGAELSEALIQQPGPTPQFQGVSYPASQQPPQPQQRSGSSSITSNNTTTTPLATTNVAGSISAADRARYTRIFASAAPQNGLLDGERAKDIFVRSKLPFDKLGAIWNLADTRARGALDLTDFVIGMHFIQGTMNGTIATIPAVLPAGLYEEASGGQSLPYVAANPATAMAASASTSSSSAAAILPQGTGGSIPRQYTGGSGYAGATTGAPISATSPLRGSAAAPASAIPSYLSPQRTGSMSSPAPIAAPLTAQHTAGSQPPVGAPSSASGPLAAPGWAVTAAEKAKADHFFDGLDTDNKAVLEGQAAVPFFMQSGLGEAVLAHVWDLSDVTQSGSLTRDEFAVAMHLINARLTGKELPQELPQELVPPSLRGQNLPQAVNPQESDTQKDLFSLMDDDPSPLPVAASAFITPAKTGSQSGNAGSQSGKVGSPVGATAAPASFDSPFDDDFFGSSPSTTAGPVAGSGAAAAGRGVNSPTPGGAATPSGYKSPTHNATAAGAFSPPGDAGAEVGNKRLQLESTAKSHESLVAQREQLDKSVSSDAAALAEIEARLSALRTSHDAEEKAVASLRQRRDAQAEELRVAREQVIRGESELSALKAERGELEQSLLRDKEESRALQRRLAELQAETAKLREETERMRRDARQQKGLAAIGKKQLATAEAAQEKVRQEIERVQAGGELAADDTNESGTAQISTPTTAREASTGGGEAAKSPAASVKSMNPFERFAAPGSAPAASSTQAEATISSQGSADTSHVGAVAGAATLGAAAVGAAGAAAAFGATAEGHTTPTSAATKAGGKSAFDAAFDESSASSATDAVGAAAQPQQQAQQQNEGESAGFENSFAPDSFDAAPSERQLPPASAEPDAVAAPSVAALSTDKEPGSIGGHGIGGGHSAAPSATAFDDAFASFDEQPAARSTSATRDEEQIVTQQHPQQQGAGEETVQSKDKGKAKAEGQGDDKGKAKAEGQGDSGLGAGATTLGATGTVASSEETTAKAAGGTAEQSEDREDTSDDEDEGPEDIEGGARHGRPDTHGSSAVGDTTAAVPGGFGFDESGAEKFPAIDAQAELAAAPATSAPTSSNVGQAATSSSTETTFGTARSGDDTVEAVPSSAEAATMARAGSAGGGVGFLTAQGTGASSSAHDVFQDAPDASEAQLGSAGHERFATAVDTLQTPGLGEQDTSAVGTASDMAAGSAGSVKTRRAPPPAPVRAAQPQAQQPAAASGATTTTTMSAPREASFDDFDSAFEDLGPAKMIDAPLSNLQQSAPGAGGAAARAAPGAGAGGAGSNGFDDAFDGFDFVPSFADVPASSAAAAAAPGAAAATNVTGFEDFDSNFAAEAQAAHAFSEGVDGGVGGGGPVSAAPPGAGGAATGSGGLSFDDAFMPTPAASQPKQAVQPQQPPPIPARNNPAAAPAAASTTTTTSAGDGGGGALPDDAAPVRQLCVMGFPRDKVIAALEKSNYRTERALERLIGSS